MSYGPLPKKIEPRKLAEWETALAGTAAIAAMPRLASNLVTDEGVVDVDLQFAKDEQNLCILTGHAHGSVLMTCQRCLEPVKVVVNAEFNLAVALTDEQAKHLPRSYDPLIIETDEIELLPVIEDELMLSLPLVPYHDDCSIQTSFGDAETARTQEEKPNPFSVLAQLKKADKS
ncbi:YceD family protein [Marinobacterium stanieri]|uniref:YceD family protein n=1 Tax=Marinobacterium stanieri TaxID=49186 RepID=UPI000255A127|nr:YceD family protein [Marinobacterium stanieri]